MANYTASRAFDAQGAIVALTTCSECGVALILDPGDSIDPRVTHDEWHSHSAVRTLGRRGGKSGTGEAKRRGDSAYYKALRAKRKPQALNVHIPPNPDDETRPVHKAP